MLKKIYLKKNEIAYLHNNGLYMQYYIIDKSLPIVVTFAPMGTQIKKEDIQKGVAETWGFEFIKSQGLNVISFGWTGKNTWYRDGSIEEFMKSLSMELDKFPERLGYGGSMGGYAVSAYSNILNLDRILIINPISTLNKSLVPWETRFRGAANSIDWESGDAYDGARAVSSGYVIYDPLFDLDKKHADRYQNLTKLKVPGVGHHMPLHLKNMQMIKWVFSCFIDNSLKKRDFYKKARKRRELQRYYNWLLSDENKHLTSKRTKTIEAYREKYFPTIRSNTNKNLFFSNYHINIIRNSAIVLEDIDIHKAYALMQVAYKLRPSGEFIKKKINEYKIKLDTS